MPDSDATHAVLRLSLVPGIGPRLGRRLLAGCRSPAAFWRQPARAWAAVPGIGERHLAALAQSDGTLADAVLAHCRRAGIGIATIFDAAYPEPLRELDDAPLLLYVRGDIACLQRRRMLAVVGTRRATREGRLVAERWSHHLAASGVGIVSGMAYGIDEAAHRGALRAGGNTVAVLGCGLDALPPARRSLAGVIAERGCVVSEFPPDRPPSAEQFPRRNRIIAGMSHATLVVEAGLKSGSLITAHQAVAYGREVFAVPGSVLGDSHAGCHQLLREGAAIATRAEDILRDMGWQDGGERRAVDFTPSSPDEAKVLRALRAGILHIDQLADAVGLTVAELSPILIGLELNGVVECLPGSRYTLAAKASASPT